jgi:small nuclear ribonucleoprotein (snRNP)-like protein
MLAIEGIKLMVALFAVSLIAFAVDPGMGGLMLAKLLAASFGVSLLFVIGYPHLRGVKKGDRVQVMRGALSQFLGFTGVVLEDCRVSEEVKVRLSRGREAIGVLESYEGLFSLPRVKLMYEERAEVMR